MDLLNLALVNNLGMMMSFQLHWVLEEYLEITKFILVLIEYPYLPVGRWVGGWLVGWGRRDWKKKVFTLGVAIL